MPTPTNRLARAFHSFRPIISMTLAAAVVLLLSPRAKAYVEIPYTLGRLIQESTHIMLLQVEKVDKTKNLIIYRKVRDIKGVHPQEVVKHNIGQAGFSPREWQTIMAWAEPGKSAVFFHNGGASETCIDNYWYQAYTGEWWAMSHSEPFLLRSFAGKPQKLAQIVKEIVDGKEVVVPCMVDGDKAALQLGTARMQRLKNSLKLLDYNPQRDFVGWGGSEDFRRVNGMPGFSFLGTLGNTGPEANGVAPADFDGDGKVDICIYGAARTILLKNDGNAFAEVSLPYGGGSRSAEWGDFNSDGKPDLLLATPKGPKLFGNQGEAFVDLSGGLPTEPYFNTTAAAFIKADDDPHPDIVLSNGFLGLRLYRNLGANAQQEKIEPSIGPWHYAGPFSNEGAKGFDTVYPPEQSIDFAAQFTGKGGTQFGWVKKEFPDGQVHSLAIFGPHNDSACVYLAREITTGATEIPISLGSDDTLTVWLNDEKILAENVNRAAIPDNTKTVLKLKAGKNLLLLKICNGSGDFGFFFRADGKPTPVQPLFVDDSAKWGLGPQGIGVKPKGDRLSVVDFDGDGRQDFLYTAGEGLLVRNTPQGFVAVPNSGMKFKTGGITPIWADLNQDHRPDLLVPQGEACKLFLNQGNGTFSPAGNDLLGPLATSSQPMTSLAFTPYNDGTAGIVAGCLRGPNRFFHLSGGKLKEASADLGLQQMIFNTRGVAVVDLNRDGAADMIFNNEGQDATVLLGNPQYPTLGKTAAR